MCSISCHREAIILSYIIFINLKHLISKIHIPVSCWLVLFLSIPKFWTCVSCVNSCALYLLSYLLNNTRLLVKCFWRFYFKKKSLLMKGRVEEAWGCSSFPWTNIDCSLKLRFAQNILISREFMNCYSNCIIFEETWNLWGRTGLLFLIFLASMAMLDWLTKI